MSERTPEIIEDKVAGIVTIDGERVLGFIDHRLSECGHVRIYSERYDAYFCPVDDRWLEKTCSDTNCMYCPTRPSRPSVGPMDVIS